MAGHFGTVESCRGSPSSPRAPRQAHCFPASPRLASLAQHGGGGKAGRRRRGLDLSEDTVCPPSLPASASCGYIRVCAFFEFTVCPGVMPAPHCPIVAGPDGSTLAAPAIAGTRSRAIEAPERRGETCRPLGGSRHSCGVCMRAWRLVPLQKKHPIKPRSNHRQRRRPGDRVSPRFVPYRRGVTDGTRKLAGRYFLPLCVPVGAPHTLLHPALD